MKTMGDNNFIVITLTILKLSSGIQTAVRDVALCYQIHNVLSMYITHIHTNTENIYD